MKIIIVAVALSAGVAFATTIWLQKPEESCVSTSSVSDFDTSLSPNQRIDALEQAISQGRYARQLLQEEIIILTEELEEFRIGTDATLEISNDSEPESNVTLSRSERRESYRRRNSPEGRAERLVEAGFDAGIADWIVQREETLQMDALQARFDAERSGDSQSYYWDRNSSNDVLRAELGDEDYERYLSVNGRPTSVGVSSVIGSSPAQTAGLRAGDEITRYDGARVYSMTDITKVTMTGEPGQNVVIDVVREGINIQIVMPRGPLGITGGRSRR